MSTIITADAFEASVPSEGRLQIDSRMDAGVAYAAIHALLGHWAELHVAPRDPQEEAILAFLLRGLSSVLRLDELRVWGDLVEQLRADGAQHAHGACGEVCPIRGEGSYTLRLQAWRLDGMGSVLLYVEQDVDPEWDCPFRVEVAWKGGLPQTPAFHAAMAAASEM